MHTNPLFPLLLQSYQSIPKKYQELAKTRQVLKKEHKKHINEHTLSNHFYHPITGYGEVLALYRQVRAKGHPISLSRIKKMAKEQEMYTPHKPIKQKFKRKQTRVTVIDKQ